ncbi:MAG: polyketide synthase dehydratase domain-containing protein [Chloroflexota bacterium]
MRSWDGDYALDAIWEAPLEPCRLRWLPHHKVGSAVVMPGAGHIQAALTAGTRVLEGPVEVVGVEFLKALTVGEGAPPDMQVSLAPDSGLWRVASRAEASSDWQLNAKGRVQRLFAPPPAPLDIAAVQRRMQRTISRDAHYAWTAGLELPFGEIFHVLTGMQVGPGEALAAYSVPPPGDADETLPITVMDAALQTGARVAADVTGDCMYLPVSVDRVRQWGRPAASGYVHARLVSISDREFQCSVSILDADGSVAIQLEGARARRFDPIEVAPVARHQQVLRASPSPATRSHMPPVDPTALVAQLAAEVGSFRQQFNTERFYEEYRQREDELCGHIAAAALALSRTPGAG